MKKFSGQFRYLLAILKFGLKEKPVLWVSVLLAFVTSGLDILSMSLLYPLSLVAQHVPLKKSGFLYRHVDERFLTTKWLILGFLVFLGLRMLSSLIQQGVTMRAGKSLHAIITSRIFGLIMSDLSMAQIQANGIGYYSSLAGDESVKASVTIINLSLFFNQLCMAGAFYIAIAVFSLKAFIFITIFVIVCFLLMLTVFKRIHNIGSKMAELSRMEHLIFIDAVNNIKSIRCYNAEELIKGNYSRNNLEYVWNIFLADYLQVVLRFVPIILLLLFAAVYVLIFMGANQVLDLAFLIALFAYLSRFFPSLGLCLNTALKLTGDAKSGKDVVGFLNTVRPVNPETSIGQLPKIQSIAFDNVSFRYEGKEQLLTDFNYDFHAGKSYAIIGPSGVGKSTLLDLLLKFYLPSRGEIRINGMRLRDISDALIRNKVVLMEQRVTIFNESVLKNITLGANIDMERVRQVCKLSQIDLFIEGLPQKYDSQIQYMGANLSGGQRQRIALARAILRNPDALILDESLSALDVETKEAIFLDLKELFKEKILISVSHDPWIIRNSSIVLDFANKNGMEGL